MLFEGRFQVSDTGIGGYDVAKDGRFLMVQPPVNEKPATRIAVVLGWLNDLETRIEEAVP